MEEYEECEVLPFKRLIVNKILEYKNASFPQKEKLSEKLFFIPEISQDFLNEIIKTKNLTKKSLSSSKEMNYFYNKFNLHQFSLSKNENYYYYKTYFLSKKGRDLKSKSHLKYLAENDPILNFNKIIQIFLELNINCDEQEMSTQINKIETFLSEMFKVYNIDFNDKTYFPPMGEYINYSYNYFTRILLTILIKFKKQRKIFKTNQQ